MQLQRHGAAPFSHQEQFGGIGGSIRSKQDPHVTFIELVFADPDLLDPDRLLIERPPLADLRRNRQELFCRTRPGGVEESGVRGDVSLGSQLSDFQTFQMKNKFLVQMQEKTFQIL